MTYQIMMCEKKINVDISYTLERHIYLDLNIQLTSNRKLYILET
jgi:hypothetical protein